MAGVVMGSDGRAFALPPPASETGVIGWLRSNLFSSVGSTVTTLVLILFLVWIIPPIVRWAFLDAIWSGQGRDACVVPGAGACWAFIKAKLPQFIYGRYPVPERWRVDLTFAMFAIGLAGLAIPRIPYKRETAIFLLGLFPVIALILLTGGNFGLSRGLLLGLLVIGAIATGLVASLAAAEASPMLGGIIAPAGAVVTAVGAIAFTLMAPNAAVVSEVLFGATILLMGAGAAVTLIAGGAAILLARGRPGARQLTTVWAGIGLLAVLYFVLNVDLGLRSVETSLWGGLLVTLVVAVVGIVASLPLGILLALGRRSRLPVIRFFSIVFIEFWRGVPLITVLFMSSVMLPMFLPPGMNFDKLLRALIGVALFSAAYMAEVVRGGLQAIPKGQYEGAQALGLGYWQMMRLIILPQALKLVIPGIVNSFIALFKDTSLVLIIGLFDLLGIIQLNFADADWASPQTPASGYAFAALVYWVFCFSMSRYSIYTERRLATGYKR